MKKQSFLRMVAMAVATVLLSAGLTACGDKMTAVGGNSVQSKDGELLFSYASTTYEAVAQGKKVGTLSNKLSEVEVYAIEGQSADEWRVTEYGEVLYAEGVQLPTLQEMQPTTLEVCTLSSGRKIRSVTDSDIIADAVQAYTEGESAPYLNWDVLRSYQLRFVSETYDFLYFTVTYIECEEDIQLDDGTNYGRYFLRSAFDEKFVPIGSGLHDLLFGSDATEATTEATTAEEGNDTNG